MAKVINLAVARKPAPIIIDVVQYSTAPDIIFAIQDWQLPVGASANFYVEKISGAKIFNGCTVDGNNIIMTPTTQLSAEEGDNKAQLEVVSGGSIAYSFPMILRVAPCMVDDSAVESQDEFTALQEALDTVSSYDGRIGTLENTTDSLGSRVGGLEDETDALNNKTQNIDNASGTTTVTGVVEIQPGSNKIWEFGSDGDLTVTINGNTYKVYTEDYRDRFRAGDTFSTGHIWCTGGISDGGKSLFFTIPLPKIVSGLTANIVMSVGGNANSITVRGNNGYVNNTQFLNLDNFIVTVDVKTGGVIVRIISTNAFTNITNNTPISVVMDATITFS